MDVDKDPGTTEKDVRSTVWCKVPRDRACEACKKAKVDCDVDWKSISEWRKMVELGRVPTRAPAGTGCKRCQSKKHSCFLPATKALREASKLKRTNLKSTAVPSHSFAPEFYCSLREEAQIRKIMEEETAVLKELLSSMTKLVEAIAIKQGAIALVGPAEAESSDEGSDTTDEEGSSSETSSHDEGPTSRLTDNE